jgi:apolipoprotein N-acyltransferase
MDHRPYEDWLLDDERLTPEQDRDLRIHLRNCPECAALARANISLRSAPVTSPAEGFALRFQTRLAAERKTQRRRSLIGLFLMAVVGVGGLVWLLSPYLPYLTLSPAQLVSLWISNLVYLALTARVVGVLGNTLLNVLVSFIPAYVWALSIALLGGTGFLWTFSFRRVGKYSHSAA